MAGIFVSYRRQDSDIAAGRLAADLADIYGEDSVFRDVSSIEAGHDFRTALEHALDSCHVLIVVIGSRWTTISDEQGRPRLQDPNDWVAAEIIRALARGIRVIPVLISAPRLRLSDVPPELHALVDLQAVELTDQHWKRDVEALAQGLDRIPGVPRRRPLPAAHGASLLVTAVPSPRRRGTRLREVIKRAIPPLFQAFGTATAKGDRLAIYVARPSWQ